MIDPGPDPVLTWVIGVVAGAAAAVVGWLALRGVFDQVSLQRTNHSGRQVPVAAGIVLFVATVAVVGLWRLVDVATRTLDMGADARILMVLLAGGFGLLGLFDDLAGTGDERGFRGHLGALADGRLTTGGLKLVGGGLLALVLAPAGPDGQTWWRMLLAAAVIALAANTANLLDRAPARATKVALVCAVALFATCGAMQRPALAGVAIVVGAAIGLVFFDAREQLMLGDTGSNILGAALGWGLAATTGWVPQVIVLVVLIALNLVSEKVSFSQVIDANPVLRGLDRLGRPDPDG